MSSRSHSVAGIIVRCIAHATSVRGGGRPASSRSRLLAGSGKRRTEWTREGLKNQHFGRMALPQPRSHVQRARTPAPLSSRKKAPAYRIFPASRDRSAGCPGDHAAAAWREGLADQTVGAHLKLSELAPLAGLGFLLYCHLKAPPQSGLFSCWRRHERGEDLDLRDYANRPRLAVGRPPRPGLAITAHGRGIVMTK
jgi:hypothetical protein